MDSKYGISPTGKQYDFFSDVGFSLNAEDFADMDYMKFIEVIQNKLTMEIENHKTSYGTTGKMYDILKKAEKNLIEW